MDKKTSKSRMPGNAKKRNPPKNNMSKIGDQGDTKELDVVQAIEDIQKVFADVAREYPSFLEETDAESDLLSRSQTAARTFNSTAKSGPGSKATTAVQSAPVIPSQCQNTPCEVEKGKKVAPLLGPNTESQKHGKASLPQLTTKKPPVPSHVISAHPHPQTKSKKVPATKPSQNEHEIIEIYCNKAEASASNTVNSDIPVCKKSSATEPIVHADTEISEGEMEQRDENISAAATAVDTKHILADLAEKKIIERDVESVVALTCKITMDSAVDAKNWPVNKNPSAATTKYTPMEAQPRFPTREQAERIQHDDFASDFIKNFVSSPRKPETQTEPIVKDYLGKNRAGAGEVALEVVKAPMQLDSTNSLKLVYKYPVWPHQVPLHKTLSRLPTLRSLVLDDSEIMWLRDLGSSLPNLITLSVMRCKLTTLDGALAFQNLENLFVADNKIKSPAPLSGLEQIRFLDLSGNLIDSFDGFYFLSGCTKLKCLKLTDTVLGNSADLHIQMRRIIPSLRELQPKNSSIHGSNIFDDYEEEENEASVACSDTDDLFNYNTSRSEQTTSAMTEISGCTSSSFGTDVKQILGRNLDSGEWSMEGGDGFSGNNEFDEEVILPKSAQIQWMEEERRLRNVYIPGRAVFKNRGPAVIPVGIDEMDALLDELELADNANANSGAICAPSGDVVTPMLGPIRSNHTDSSSSVQPTTASSTQWEHSDTGSGSSF